MMQIKLEGAIMKPIRALSLTSWIYTTLIWLYCVTRIVVNEIDPNDPFIIGIPITFLELSIIMFLISATSCYVYLIKM
jgi:hypothetical protein